MSLRTNKNRLTAVGKFAQMIHKYRMLCTRKYKLRVHGRLVKMVRNYILLTRGERPRAVINPSERLAKLIKDYLNLKLRKKVKKLTREEEYDSEAADEKYANRRRLKVIGKFSQMIHKYSRLKANERRLEVIGKFSQMIHRYVLRQQKIASLRATSRWHNLSRMLLDKEPITPSSR